MPVIMPNGQKAPQMADARNLAWVAIHCMNTEKPVPATYPMGPSTRSVTGTVTSIVQRGRRKYCTFEGMCFLKT